MRLDPTTTKVGGETVTHFSMIHNEAFQKLESSLGAIVIEFSRLEYLVKAGIELLYRKELERAHISNEELTFSEGMEHAEGLRVFEKQCDELCELLSKQEPSPEKREAYAALAIELKEIGRERNAIVHSCWTATEDKEVWLRLRSRLDKKKLFQKAENITLNYLVEFQKRVNHRWFILVASLGGEIGHVVPIKGDYGEGDSL